MTHFYSGQQVGHHYSPRTNQPSTQLSFPEGAAGEPYTPITAGLPGFPEGAAGEPYTPITAGLPGFPEGAAGEPYQPSNNNSHPEIAVGEPYNPIIAGLPPHKPQTSVPRNAKGGMKLNSNLINMLIKLLQSLIR